MSSLHQAETAYKKRTQNMEALIAQAEEEAQASELLATTAEGDGEKEIHLAIAAERRAAQTHYEVCLRILKARIRKVIYALENPLFSCFLSFSEEEKRLLDEYDSTMQTWFQKYNLKEELQPTPQRESVLERLGITTPTFEAQPS